MRFFSLSSTGFLLEEYWPHQQKVTHSVLTLETQRLRQSAQHAEPWSRIYADYFCSRSPLVSQRR